MFINKDLYGFEGALWMKKESRIFEIECQLSVNVGNQCLDVWMGILFWITRDHDYFVMITNNIPNNSMIEGFSVDSEVSPHALILLLSFLMP